MDGKLTLAGRKKLLAVVASVISWHLLMYFWSFLFFLCLACDHVSLWLVYYSRVEKKMTNLFLIFGDSLGLSISSVFLRLNPLMAESGSREWQCSIYSRGQRFSGHLQRHHFFIACNIPIDHLQWQLSQMVHILIPSML